MENKIKYDRSKIKAIGGSQIGALIGVSNYQTPLDVYNQIINDIQIPDNLPMKIGRLLESTVASNFETETGRVVKEPNQKFQYHKDFNFLIASPDRIFFNTKLNGVLECKTTKMKWDSIPESYYAQLIWYMGILGYDFGSLAWLNILSDKFEYRDFEFNKEIYEQLIESAVKFWNENILKQIPPEPINAVDVRKYITKHIEGKIMIAVPETYGLITELKQLKEKKKLIESEIETVENSLLPVIADNEALTDEGGNLLLTYKASKDSETFDTKKFKSENPELYKKYILIKPGARRLLLK